MTNLDLAAALRELKITRIEFAVLCGVERETVYRWLRDPDAPGALPVPVYAQTIVRMMRGLREIRSQVS